MPIINDIILSAHIALLLQGCHFYPFILVQFCYGRRSSTQDWAQMWQVMASGFSDLNHSEI
jgi:hypothetical protein